MAGNSVMKRNQSLSEEVWHGKQMKCNVVLRLLAFISTLVATLIMTLNKQTTNIAGYPMHASYNSSPAFKFFVAGNAVVCAYSILSLACVPTIIDSYLLPILDMMSMALLMAAASAATAIAHLGKKGNDDIGWSKVCPYFDKFCNKVGFSLVASYIGFVVFLVICAQSSVHKTRHITDSY